MCLILYPCVLRRHNRLNGNERNWTMAAAYCNFKNHKTCGKDCAGGILSIHHDLLDARIMAIKQGHALLQHDALKIIRIADSERERVFEIDRIQSRWTQSLYAKKQSKVKLDRNDKDGAKDKLLAIQGKQAKVLGNSECFVADN